MIALHWLGGSARTWTEVGKLLAARGYQFVALDLPGFGHAVDSSAFSVSAMADEVIASIRELRGESYAPWVLVGHSMGGKLAAIIARAAEDGSSGLEDLSGLVLISPSPVGPEPMKDSKRDEMREALGQATSDATENRKRAKKFVDDNTGKLPLVESVLSRSIDDVLRMNRDAFVAWLNSGSKEDWSARAGVLALPTLIMAGTEEKALGPDAQREHAIPHFSHVSLTPLQGGGHLGPLERPYEIAGRAAAFLTSIRVAPHRASASLSPRFQALLESDRTSSQTRDVLERRLTEPQMQDSIFSSDDLLVLRCLVELVIPNSGFDLCLRVEEALASKLDDGWRFDSLPADIEAWRRGLRSLEAEAVREFDVPFIALDAVRQNELLQKANDGKSRVGILEKLGGREDEDAKLSGQQMHDWFEDVRGELVQIYVSDPRTLDRIDFTGFADEKGFTQIRLGEQEEFEI